MIQRALKGGSGGLGLGRRLSFRLLFDDLALQRRGAVGELAVAGLQQEIVEPATMLDRAQGGGCDAQSHRAAEGVGDQGHPAQVRQKTGARPVVGMADLVAGLDGDPRQLATA